MPRQFICAYGNCETYMQPKDSVLINDAQSNDQQRFCCLEHAGLWALRIALKRDRGPVEVFRDRVQIELAR